MMILHAKQECTRFSTLSLDFDSTREGQKVRHTLSEREISLAVTTMNVFAEGNINREQTPAFFIFKEK